MGSGRGSEHIAMTMGMGMGMRGPVNGDSGYCFWCGQALLPKKKGFFCRGHWRRWWQFWYGRPPGYVIVVFARDLFRCQLCGYEASLDGWSSVRKQLHIDHVVPVSRGGLHVLANMRTLCRTCNLSRGNRDEDWEPKAVRHDKAKLQAWIKSGASDDLYTDGA